MELINSEEKQSAEERVPEPAEPRARVNREDVDTENGQSLLRVILLALAAIILVVLIVLFARWIYHVTHKNVQPAPANTKKLPAQPSGSASNQTAKNTQSSSAASSSGAGSTSANSSGTSTKLPNNGPGDTAAIFAGASLAAAGLHYIISLRRFNKTGA